MRNEVSVEIDRPIDEVFRLTNDHIAKWSIIVVEDEVLDEKPEGVGTTFRTVTEERGKLFMFLFGWMMKKSNCKGSENEFESLKRFCEGHPVPADT